MEHGGQRLGLFGVGTGEWIWKVMRDLTWFFVILVSSFDTELGLLVIDARLVFRN